MKRHILTSPHHLLAALATTTSSRSLAWQPTVRCSTLAHFTSSKAFFNPSIVSQHVQQKNDRRLFSRKSVRTYDSSSSVDNHPPSSSTSAGSGRTFRPGDKVQVEVVSFGPLGASVEVIGLGHDAGTELLSADDEPYGEGLILQKEIAYFRSARDQLDVVLGEVLPAHVQNQREEDGKLDIGLRAFGGKGKAQEVGAQIIEKLKWASDGTLQVGDKSPPGDINREFPGVSKTAFKKAVGALYKKGLIKPSPTSITIVNDGEQA